MVFASTSFIFFFLPIFLLVYAIVKPAWRNLTILIFSWIFYAWWRLDFLALIVSIAVWSWTTGLMIERSEGRRRKHCLWIGIAWPLLSLFWFKYANLIVDSIGVVWRPIEGWEKIALPIGLSFFVFGAISYSVDVYRRTVPAEKSFIAYATYQSMFGHLVAGPVVRYKWVAERLQHRAFDRNELFKGIERFMQGFALKILIADTLSPLVGAGFQLAHPSFSDACLAVLAYTLQLYFDFVAYSSMAIGLGLMVGLKFPENFNNPYLCTSITTFWRNWHISLSSWLRDYLYIPLGGSHHGTFRACLNLLITMALGGLWHGASWTFMIWGLLHGSALVTEKLWKSANWYTPPALVGHVLMLLFVMFGWLLFRAENWHEFATMLHGLSGANGMGISVNYLAEMHTNQIVCLFLGIFLVYLPKIAEKVTVVQRMLPGITQMSTLPLWLLAVVILQGRTVVPFLYFQF